MRSKNNQIKPQTLRLGLWVQMTQEAFDEANYAGMYSTREFRIEGFADGSSREGSTLICHYTIPTNDGYNGKIHSGAYDVDLEGIILTEEWLKKAGFHYNEECKYWIDGTWELVFLKDGSLWQVRGHSELDGSTWFLKKIRYVHEFQNIYYEINEFDPFDKDSEL